MSIKLTKHWLIMLFLLTACVERFDIPSIHNVPRIVVDGMITNEPGPYTVEVYMSSGINENPNEAKRIEDAVVSISDDAGNTEILTEESAGVYKTMAGGIQGIVGRTYQLKFTTQDGLRYESPPAKMEPAGTIDNLYFEFKYNEINGHDPFLPQHVVAIYMDGKGESGSPNYMRWRWSSIFEATTSPQLRTEWIDGVETPAPPPCSVPICTCCHCWVRQKGSSINVSNNHISNEVNFNKVLLIKIPVDSWTFSERYYLEAQQLSIQKDVHDFWKLVAVQQQGGTNIFQPNTASVKGNITCIDNPKEKVYGVFSVSAIVKEGIYIDRYDLPDIPPFPSVVTSPCVGYFKNATYEKPGFW